VARKAELSEVAGKAKMSEMSEMPKLSKGVTTTGSQLPVMDSHYLWMITIRKHPRFRLKGTPMLTFDTFQFPYRFRRALSPYMVQETLIVDGSASEVLWTHVQRRRHSRQTSSTSTAL
jgi:hypothetical protein